jgi:hypothetical protein
MTVTYQLDPITWDRVVGPDGNYVLISDGAQIAQDVQCAIRTFFGECWYDTTQGVPYRESILGVWPPPATSFLKAQIVRAAATVPTVTACTVTQLQLVNRRMTGVALVSTTVSAVPIEVVF